MKTSKLLWITLAVVVLLFLGRTGSSQTTVTLDGASPFHVLLKLDDPYASEGRTMVPIAYKEPTAGIVLYVESDHRHVSAINQEGKLLWFRDPFADAFHDIWPRNPGIVKISASTDGKHALISYGPSNTGTVDLATGKPESWNWVQ